jgi:hypothetical protein
MEFGLEPGTVADWQLELFMAMALGRFCAEQRSSLTARLSYLPLKCEYCQQFVPGLFCGHFYLYGWQWRRTKIILGRTRSKKNIKIKIVWWQWLRAQSSPLSSWFSCSPPTSRLQRQRHRLHLLNTALRLWSRHHLHLRPSCLLYSDPNSSIGALTKG